MINSLKRFVSTELFRYLVIGITTTIISFVSFSIFYKFFEYQDFVIIKSWALAEALSFVIAISYSFFADKFIVFRHPYNGLKSIVKEMFQFVLSRIFAEFVCYVIMHILIDIYNINPIIVKCITMFIVVILNYLTSKFFVFRK